MPIAGFSKFLRTSLSTLSTCLLQAVWDYTFKKLGITNPADHKVQIEIICRRCHCWSIALKSKIGGPADGSCSKSFSQSGEDGLSHRFWAFWLWLLVHAWSNAYPRSRLRLCSRSMALVESMCLCRPSIRALFCVRLQNSKRLNSAICTALFWGHPGTEL